MLGRNPDRFRLDAVGNPVCRVSKPILGTILFLTLPISKFFKIFKQVLTNCLGPLCHEYDHIFPFSKGGTTSVENCQILQTTVNRVKSNRVEITHNEMKAASPKLTFTGD